MDRRIKRCHLRHSHLYYSRRSHLHEYQHHCHNHHQHEQQQCDRCRSNLQQQFSKYRHYQGYSNFQQQQQQQQHQQQQHCEQQANTSSTAYTQWPVCRRCVTVPAPKKAGTFMEILKCCLPASGSDAENRPYVGARNMEALEKMLLLEI